MSRRPTAPRATWLRRTLWWLRWGPERLAAARLRRHGQPTAALRALCGDHGAALVIVHMLLATARHGAPDLTGYLLRRGCRPPRRLRRAWRWSTRGALP